MAEYEHDSSILSDFPVSKTRKLNIFVILEVFYYTFPGTPLAGPGRLPPDFETPDFFELNLSDRAEAFRIDAVGELINVADYEHDPSTLSDFSVSEKLV